MIELTCSFCDEVSRVDLASVHAAVCVLRCDGCGVEVDVLDDAPVALASAA